MITELQNKVWSILPKEFKEEVKKLYIDALVASNSPHEPDDRKWGNYRVALLGKLFGLHNLTSDAEGEEMLTVPRKKVQEKWQRAYEQEAKYSKAEQNPTTREELYYNRGIMSVIDTLFGSKCLPDEGTDCTPVEVGVAENATTSNVDSSHGNVESLETKPSIPKFKHKLGDKVRIVNDWSYGYKHNGEVTEIVAIDESDPEVPYKVDIYDEEEGGGLWYQESDLEPYTEPILQPFSQVKETAASTISNTSTLNNALLKLEEASKQVREELTKLNEK